MKADDNMRGSIVQKSNKFYAVIDLPRGNDGKRKQKWISNALWKKRKDVERDLPRLLTEAQDGLLHGATTTKYTELLKQWHQSVEISLRHNSLRSYRWAVKHIDDGLGRHKITAIKPLHISNFMIQKSEQGLSNTSLRMIYAVLKKSLQQAVDWQIIRYNPCDKVQRPSKLKYQASVYGPERLSELLQAVDGTKAYWPVLIAIATGMRRSEIAALRWQDIDFKDSSLTVRNTITEGGVKLGLQPVKTQLSERVIVLPKYFLDKLITLKETSKSDFVVSREDGKPYNPSYLWRCFKDVIRKAGLPETRFQDLRHAHATHLIMSNVPVKTVSERLGHYSTAFTQDIYGHVLRPSQDKAAAVMNSLLENRLEDDTETPQ